MEEKVVMLNVLYRHFKGDYYLVEKVVTNEKDKEPYIVYTSTTSGKSYIRPYSEFFDIVTDRSDNITHQVYRFEPANEIKGILKLTPTEDIVAELETRGDNPYEGFKTLEEDENVWSVQYLLGRVTTSHDYNTESDYEEFIPVTLVTFDTLEAAKAYRDKCYANRSCVIARRVTKKVAE